MARLRRIYTYLDSRGIEISLLGEGVVRADELKGASVTGLLRVHRDDAIDGLVAATKSHEAKNDTVLDHESLASLARSLALDSEGLPLGDVGGKRERHYATSTKRSTLGESQRL